MEIGFTGTREGMTEEQKKTVRSLLIAQEPTRAHHGDCVGADADFHAICREFGLIIKGHPPVKEQYRAFCDFDETEVARNYYTRNRDIVHSSDLLIATPKEDKEQSNGGTWYTVGYARTAGKPFVIVWPDGNLLCTPGRKHETDG